MPEINPSKKRKIRSVALIIVAACVFVVNTSYAQQVQKDVSQPPASLDEFVGTYREVKSNGQCGEESLEINLNGRTLGVDGGSGDWHCTWSNMEPILS